MDKFMQQQQVLERLAEDLLQVEQAAWAAREAATHEENIAEKPAVGPWVSARHGRRCAAQTVQLQERHHWQHPLHSIHPPPPPHLAPPGGSPRLLYEERHQQLDRLDGFVLGNKR
jgi:hypothetical protein